jgi:hypothetical protein
MQPEASADGGNQQTQLHDDEAAAWQLTFSSDQNQTKVRCPRAAALHHLRKALHGIGDASFTNLLYIHSID